MAKRNLEQLANTSELLKNQWAMFAARNLGRQKNLVLPAMREHYLQFGLDDDPILNSAFAEAQGGLQAGHITNEGVMKAISVYSNKYNEAFGESTVADIVASSGYELPAHVSSAINEFGNIKYKDLVKYIDDNTKPEEGRNKAKKVSDAVNILENYKFDSRMQADLVSKYTAAGLEGLFPKPAEQHPQ